MLPIDCDTAFSSVGTEKNDSSTSRMPPPSLGLTSTDLAPPMRTSPRRRGGEPPASYGSRYVTTPFVALCETVPVPVEVKSSPIFLFVSVSRISHAWLKLYDPVTCNEVNFTGSS